MDYKEYREEINSLAVNIVDELHLEVLSDEPGMESDDINEILKESGRLYEYISEAVDNHMWIIYYSYNRDVIEHSNDPDAYKEVYDNESIGQLVSEKGLDDLNMMIAYFAMLSDVTDEVSRL